MVMKKFRKRPLVVEAIQVELTQEFYEFFQMLCPSAGFSVIDYDDDEIYPIDEAEWRDAEYIELNIDETTTLKFYRGDYLVKGVDGSIYPVKEDTFNKIYESDNSENNTGKIGW